MVGRVTFGPGRSADISPNGFDPSVMARVRDSNSEPPPASPAASDPAERFRAVLECVRNHAWEPRACLSDGRPTLDALRKALGMGDISPAERDAAWEAVQRDA